MDGMVCFSEWFLHYKIFIRIFFLLKLDIILRMHDHTVLDCLFIWIIVSESLRLLSLNDNKYLRYFKGHHDRFGFWCTDPYFHFDVIAHVVLVCVTVS